jgi:hypothetical protein
MSADRGDYLFIHKFGTFSDKVNHFLVPGTYFATRLKILSARLEDKAYVAPEQSLAI